MASIQAIASLTCALTDLSLSSLTESAPMAYNILMRCMRADFQTPSSNSCNISTVRISVISNPASARWLLKAFLFSQSAQLVIVFEHQLNHTSVGTRLVRFRRDSTVLLLTACPSSYISVTAFLTSLLDLLACLILALNFLF